MCMAIYQNLMVIGNCVMELQESYRKASIICPESEIEELGGCSGSTPEQLSAQLSRLSQRLQHESQRYGCDMLLFLNNVKSSASLSKLSLQISRIHR